MPLPDDSVNMLMPLPSQRSSPPPAPSAPVKGAGPSPQTYADLHQAAQLEQGQPAKSTQIYYDAIDQMRDAGMNDREITGHIQLARAATLENSSPERSTNLYEDAVSSFRDAGLSDQEIGNRVRAARTPLHPQLAGAAAQVQPQLARAAALEKTDPEQSQNLYEDSVANLRDAGLSDQEISAQIRAARGQM